MASDPLERLYQLRDDARRSIGERQGGRAGPEVLVGTATCGMAAGAVQVLDALKRAIESRGIGNVSIGEVGCVGRCVKEPLVEVVFPGRPPVYYENVSPESAGDIIDSIVRETSAISGQAVPAPQLVPAPQAAPAPGEGPPAAIPGTMAFLVCSGAGCHSGRSKEIEMRLLERIKDFGLEGKAGVIEAGCLGFCEEGPIVIVYPGEITYSRVTPEDIDQLLDYHLAAGGPSGGALTKPPGGTSPESSVFPGRLPRRIDRPPWARIRAVGDAGLLQKQVRIALRNCGIVDPEDVGDYLNLRGYEALARVLAQGDPQWVIDQVKNARLRGRGGAGFPTGIKWQIVADSHGQEKFVVCNADEGDPGAFMDRSVLEGDPHSVLEGMAIGGFAVGASRGFIYVRAEYPVAVERLAHAIDEARKLGLLGNSILGGHFHFDIELRLGAGAFVCGEETALIASIEGRRGMPRPRPPYPAVKGLWGAPTLINNVETWANVPAIMLYGQEWFSRTGTDKSKGTKVFALAGKIQNTGLVEVPIGTSLREVVFDIGGGTRSGKAFKAAQTGGPSGGCLPAKYLDLPLDYEALVQAGSMMGSGGLIVMDEDSCMVQVARFFLEFTQEESCGKCTPCREGTKRMLEILTRITEGKGREDDLDKLVRLGKMIKRASLCGLGQSAPNPVLSTLEHFRDEYVAHILERRCPAGACVALLSFHIDPSKCTGCGLCRRACPADAIRGELRKPHEIIQERCIKCGECMKACKKYKAIYRQ